MIGPKPQIKLDGCIVLNEHNTVFDRSSQLSVHKLYTSSIRLCIIVTFLRLSDVSVICRDTYFQFPIQSAFLPYISHQAPPALRRTIGFNTQYRMSDVAENLGRYLSCTERTSRVKDFELILIVKMETRHPAEGSFSSGFPAICNHCGVMTA